MLKEMTLLKPSWSQTKFMNVVVRWGLIGKDGLGEKLGGKNNNTIIKIYFITCTKLSINKIIKKRVGTCLPRAACPGQQENTQPGPGGRTLLWANIWCSVGKRETEWFVSWGERQIWGGEADEEQAEVGGLFANWSHGDVGPGLLSKPMSGSMPCWRYESRKLVPLAPPSAMCGMGKKKNALPLPSLATCGRQKSWH